jgi:hypothetical protein
VIVLDAARYLGVCLLFVSAGAGLIRLLRVPLASTTSLLLGASVTQALLAICGSSAVCLGIPLAYLALPVWIALLALALHGARWWIADWRAASVEAAVDGDGTTVARAATHRQIAVLLAVSLVAAPVAMLPYFVYGLADYPGSGLLDGWSYVAFGQYLWEFPRATEGGLAPLYQYASHLSHTRFVASTALALLSPLASPGDTQAVSGLLRALSIFTLAVTCAAFAHVKRLPLRLACAYVGLAAISGWTIAVVWANNYDQQFALPYSPALATLAVLLPAWTLSSAVLAGILAAGALHTYPELSMLPLGIATLLGVEAMLARRAWRALRYVPVTLLTMAVLLGPYARDCVGMIAFQLRNGLASGPRPGDGMFPGLLDPHYQLSALVGLGGEQLVSRDLLAATILAIVLIAAFVAGVGRMLWRRELALPLAIAGLCAMVATLIGRQAYAYGAYKVLSLGWWAFAFAIVGVAASLTGRRGWWRMPAAVIAYGLVLAVPAVTAVRTIAETATAGSERISQYRVIEQLPAFLGHVPIVLNTSDVEAEHWGTYFLRREPMLLGTRYGYLGMPHLVALIGRARPIPPATVRYVVTDPALAPATVRAAGWRLVWAVGRFAVWDSAPQGWASVIQLHDALRNLALFRPYFHAGPPGATLQVVANRAGTLRLSGRLFNAYVPDSPDRSCWRLALHEDAATAAGQPTGTAITAQDLAMRSGITRVDLPIVAGTSVISLSATPMTPSAPAGTRELAREGSFMDVTTELLPIGAPATALSVSDPTCAAAAPPAQR